jgi:hypothetical protein
VVNNWFLFGANIHQLFNNQNFEKSSKTAKNDIKIAIFKVKTAKCKKVGFLSFWFLEENGRKWR